MNMSMILMIFIAAGAILGGVDKILGNRFGLGQVGQVKVSVQKTKGCKQMQPMKRAANY